MSPNNSQEKVTRIFSRMSFSSHSIELKNTGEEKPELVIPQRASGYRYKSKYSNDVDSFILIRYVGDYELRPDLVLSIRLTNNQLTAQAIGQREFELFASSETDFFTMFFEGATFLVEEGKVNGFVWHEGGRDSTARRLES
jgi:Domain of unknown function (DUF3471)